MSTISPQARQELVTAVAERYQRSTPAERGRILDEFVALTGYHRKHAIRVLNGSSAMPAVRRGRRSVYDEAVTEGLVVLWEASDRVCGKRLKALLPTLVPALERCRWLPVRPRVGDGSGGALPVVAHWLRRTARSRWLTSAIRPLVEQAPAVMAKTMPTPVLITVSRSLVSMAAEWRCGALPADRGLSEHPVARAALHRTVATLRLDPELEVQTLAVEHAEAVAEPI